MFLFIADFWHVPSWNWNDLNKERTSQTSICCCRHGQAHSLFAFLSLMLFSLKFFMLYYMSYPHFIWFTDCFLCFPLFINCLLACRCKLNLLLPWAQWQCLSRLLGLQVCSFPADHAAPDSCLVFPFADWGPAGPFLVQTPKSSSQNEAKRRPHHQAAVGGRSGETALPRHAAIASRK